MDSLLSSISSYWTPSVQIIVLVIFVTVIRKFILRRKNDNVEEPTVERLPPMEKRDFTLEELIPYNGVDNERVLIAVNGKVFDVTAGKSFYGPDGPYSIFAGHDASRGLATFSIDASTIKGTYDDLSDLNQMQVESMLEWEMQFTEKYTYVGKLLKPGEQHTNYTEAESEDETKTEREKKTE